MRCKRANSRRIEYFQAGKPCIPNVRPTGLRRQTPVFPGTPEDIGVCERFLKGKR